jgi:hypothetical protein
MLLDLISGARLKTTDAKMAARGDSGEKTKDQSETACLLGAWGASLDGS